jgi:hypothetical protein
VQKGNTEIMEIFRRRESISIFGIRKAGSRWSISTRNWTDLNFDMKIINQGCVSGLREDTEGLSRRGSAV